MALFSSRLKHETEEDHQKAETTRFMDELLSGKLQARDYARLINQYVHLYPALEHAVDVARLELPQLGQIMDPQLERAELLMRDADALSEVCGTPTAINSTPTRATTKYVSHLNKLATLSEPGDAYRILTHHYLRYLGDLSGGQIIARLVQRHYAIDPAMVSAWDFSHISKLKAYKDQYRSLLDELVTDPEDQQTMIDEAKLGFRLNAQLFNSLEATELSHA